MLWFLFVDPFFWACNIHVDFVVPCCFGLLIWTVEFPSFWACYMDFVVPVLGLSHGFWLGVMVRKPQKELQVGVQECVNIP